MEKLHYLHFAYIENGIVKTIYVFDPSTIAEVTDESDAPIYLEAISSKPADSFVNCFNGDNVKGVYPEVGYKYNKEADVFSQ